MPNMRPKISIILILIWVVQISARYNYYKPKYNPNYQFRYAQAKAKNDEFIYSEKYSRAYIDTDGSIKFRGDGKFSSTRKIPTNLFIFEKLIF